MIEEGGSIGESRVRAVGLSGRRRIGGGAGRGWWLWKWLLGDG